MKQFYLVRNKFHLSPVDVDHNTCGALMSHAPAHMLTKDLDAWVKIAESGDAFEIRDGLGILCLDLEAMLRRRTAGPKNRAFAEIFSNSPALLIPAAVLQDLLRDVECYCIDENKTPCARCVLSAHYHYNEPRQKDAYEKQRQLEAEISAASEGRKDP